MSKPETKKKREKFAIEEAVIAFLNMFMKSTYPLDMFIKMKNIDIYP